VAIQDFSAKLFASKLTQAVKQFGTRKLIRCFGQNSFLGTNLLLVRKFLTPRDLQKIDGLMAAVGKKHQNPA